MGRVDGKVALITGGARGQGRSHALTLAREGADIVVTDVCDPIPEVLPYETATEADLNESVRLVEELDRRCLGIKADCRSNEQMQAAIDQTIREFGRLDILCVNHGVFTGGPWDTLTDAQFEANIDVNLTGVWRCVRPAIPHMIDQGAGPSSSRRRPARSSRSLGCWRTALQSTGPLA